ncbi:MAG: V-type ATP synthase subunit C [Firmicutes bacterium]|jgi:V/A-type H+-transporting ATPase subunit C|nr:V-type ATP synthase subunit C [Bacillota bacterium]NLL87612.1 V-type ATP synthase subunit C [Bacillota bacterium]
MKESTDTRYVYTISRIRVIEQKMLSPAMLERMIEAGTPEEALKVLHDAGYGYAGEGYSVGDYERLLSEEQEKVYRLLMETVPDTREFDFLIIKNDYHNLKVCLKAEFSDQAVEDAYLLSPSLVPGKQLMDLLRERNFSGLPAPMAESAAESIEAFTKMQDPQVIDLILDKAHYGHMLMLSDGLGSEFVSKLVNALVDLTNLKMLLRAKLIKKPRGFLESLLIEGGSFDKEFYHKLFELGYDQIASACVDTEYYRLLTESINALKLSGSLAGFEKLCDNYLVDVLKTVKYAIFGIEPLVAYYLAKELEIKNVRIIMVGKINGLAQYAIRERLRETYV